VNKELDAAFARLAQAQHQVVSRRQALQLGFSARAVDGRLASGRLDRLLPGVYALPGAPASLHRDAMASCLRLGPPSVTSHEAAAALHGIGYVAAPGAVVTTSITGPDACALARVHRTRHLDPPDVTAVDGIPVTTPARTLVDLAMVLRPGRLRRVVDGALADRRVDFEALDETFGAVGRGGRRGRAAMGRILLELGPGTAVPESELEHRVLALLRQAKIEPPELQTHPAWLPTPAGRVDFAWPAARLVLEADGRRWHTRDADHERDLDRDNAAQLAGWRVLRFRWRKVKTEPEAVARAVRTMLAMPA
jgi:hypothetical protein